MIRFTAPLVALAICAMPLAAQTYTEAEQAAMARIEAEHPLVHALMDGMGRYENIVTIHQFWLDDMENRFFYDMDPALWEVQIAQALTTDGLMLAYAAAVADLPLTPEIVAYGIDFYSSDLATRLQVIENNIGRNRIRDADDYDTTLAAFQAFEGTDDPRVALLQRAEEVNQAVDFLLDRSFNQELAFNTGLNDAGWYFEPKTEAELRETVEFDRDATRPEIVEYYNVYRTMMLEEVSIAEYGSYLDVFDSPEGRIIGDFMDDGSDALMWAHHYHAGVVSTPIFIAQWEAEQAASAADAGTQAPQEAVTE